MKEFYSEQFAATFAGNLAARLQPPCVNGQRKLKLAGINREYLVWLVKGLWPLRAHNEDGRTAARLDVCIGSDWIIVPPPVKVNELFMRQDVDWHMNSDGTLCYVLKDEWSETLEEVLDNSDGDITYTIDFAASWLLSAVDSLAARHLIGFRHCLKKWPADWHAYAHYDAGVAEYRREQLQRGD